MVTEAEPREEPRTVAMVDGEDESRALLTGLFDQLTEKLSFERRDRQGSSARSGGSSSVTNLNIVIVNRCVNHGT